MNRYNSTESNHLIHFLEALQKKGRLTFSAPEAVQTLGISKIAFSHSAHRLIKKGRLIHPARGFYVIVPVEHQVAGAPPATSFIDAFMKFQEQPYYIGILSAASLHGAAHQSPQELQVVTSAPLKTITVGRSRIRFITKRHPENTPTQLVRVPTGDIPVSTPEATAFDLVLYPQVAGFLSNIATLLIELSEKIDPKKLPATAKIFSEAPLAQRLGYLLDTFVSTKATQELHAWVEKQRPRWTFLRPGWKSILTKQALERNEKWHININEKVEPDV